MRLNTAPVAISLSLPVPEDNSKQYAEHEEYHYDARAINNGVDYGAVTAFVLLRKKLTVMGIIGHTQGVIRAIRGRRGNRTGVLPSSFVPSCFALLLPAPTTVHDGNLRQQMVLPLPVEPRLPAVPQA